MIHIEKNRKKGYYSYHNYQQSQQKFGKLSTFKHKKLYIQRKSRCTLGWIPSLKFKSWTNSKTRFSPKKQPDSSLAPFSVCLNIPTIEVKQAELQPASYPAPVCRQFNSAFEFSPSLSSFSFYILERTRPDFQNDARS